MMIVIGDWGMVETKMVKRDWLRRRFRIDIPKGMFWSNVSIRQGFGMQILL